MKCPRCNEQVKAGAKFCGRCGEKVHHRISADGDVVAVGGSKVFKGNMIFNLQGYGGMLVLVALFVVVLCTITIIIAILVWPPPTPPGDNGVTVTTIPGTLYPTYTLYPTNTPYSTTIPGTLYPTYTLYPTNTPYSTTIISATPSPSQKPATGNFFACRTPCKSNGSNGTSHFPEKTTSIYLRWEFSNFPKGANYSRIWQMDGREWIHYECTWPGPVSGTDEVTLTEPQGLHSGEWQVIISIDGIPVMSESIYIDGDWDYWDPVGYFEGCYGKK